VSHLQHIQLWLTIKSVSIDIVGFDITPVQVYNILFSGQRMNSSFILDNTFIQFEDISAKLALSASVSGSLNLAEVATLDLVNGTVDMALGMGMDRVSDKIYFSELKSVSMSLRDDASWQKIGVIDVALPIKFDLGDVGIGLGDVLGAIPNLPLIISIRDDDLFSSELPSVGMDLDLL
jgi:hypothetical protein